jgi:hypothetical protein
MLIKRSHLLAATAVVLALGMAGCGGGDGGDLGFTANNNARAGSGSGGASGSAGGSGNGQSSNAFISRVMEIIGMTAENAEPVAIESVTVSSPDNTEPEPVS